MQDEHRAAAQLILDGSRTQTDWQQHSSSTVGLENIHRWHPNLSLGKRQGGSCQGSSVPVAINHARKAGAAQSWHWAVQTPQDTAWALRMCARRILWDQGTHWAPWAAQCVLSLQRAQVCGDVWIKYLAHGSAGLGAWPWEHLATLLQRRLVCDALGGAQQAAWGMQMLSG